MIPFGDHPDLFYNPPAVNSGNGVFHVGINTFMFVLVFIRSRPLR